MKRRLCDRLGVQKTVDGGWGEERGESKSEWKQGEFLTSSLWLSRQQAVAVYLLIAPIEKVPSAVTEQEPSYAGCLSNTGT